MALLAGMYVQQIDNFALAAEIVPATLLCGMALMCSARLRWLGFVLIGLAWYANAVHEVVDSRLQPELVGESLIARVLIDEFPREQHETVTFLARPLDDRRLPKQLQVSWLRPPVALYPGDVWQFELRLRRPRAKSNPGGRNTEGYLTRRRIGALAFVVQGRRNHLLASGVSGFVGGLRMRFVSRVVDVVADPQRSAIIVALVAGSRHLVSREQWDRFAQTGTSHLMAISGLHIGLAAAFGYALARLAAFFWRGRGNPHRVALVAAVVVGILYSIISGLAIPSRRASLMIVFGTLALLGRRRPEMLRILSTTAICMAMLDPLVTMSAGFRLSFAAVAILLWQARRHEGSRGLYLRSRQLATSQMLLLFGLFPIVVSTFAQLSIVAPIVNLVAVPVFSLLTVPFSLAGLVLDGPVRPIGDLCLQFAAVSLRLIEPLLTAFADQYWSAPSVLLESAWARTCAGIVMLWLILPVGWPGRAVAWLALIGLLLARPPAPENGCAQFSVLDVGQGLSVVIETRKHMLVYDTGPAYPGGRNTTESILLPFLKRRGVTEIDRLVISHADLDHAGGAAPLLGSLAVKNVTFGEEVPGMPRSARRCVAGERWQWDAVTFEFLHPEIASRFSGNDASCVLLVGAGKFRLLIPGDIEGPAEKALLQYSDPGAVDVVIAPHHGSNTSSSPAFVESLKPSLVIVAAGFLNRWGFPKPEVVERWAATGAEVVTTGNEGAVILKMCSGADRFEHHTTRSAQRRIWHE